jgi:hypothetical protein
MPSYSSENFSFGAIEPYNTMKTSQKINDPGIAI